MSKKVKYKCELCGTMLEEDIDIGCDITVSIVSIGEEAGTEDEDDYDYETDEEEDEFAVCNTCRLKVMGMIYDLGGGFEAVHNRRTTNWTTGWEENK
jgi:hypothetical protein